jgi:hypothetical protein
MDRAAVCLLELMPLVAAAVCRYNDTTLGMDEKAAATASGAQDSTAGDANAASSGKK